MKKILDYLKQHIDKLFDFFKQYKKHYVFLVEGTFVAWIKWGEDMPKGEELQEYLEKEAFFSVDMGMEYGENLEHYTRINLATTPAQMDGLLKRLEKMLTERTIK